MPTPTSQVAEYYDSNTRPFLRWGGSGEAVGAIHREIWAPGVNDSASAFEHVNRYVLAQLSKLRPAGAPLKVLDLGCGIGGTSTWLAARTDATFVGVTLSAVQCEWATRRAAALGYGSRCRFSTADMTQTPLDPGFDLAFAIESLVHCEPVDAFFREAARLVRTGGHLVVCDDFLAKDTPARATPWLATFVRGWSAFGLRPWQEVARVAASHGWQLAHCEDVTQYQKVVPAWGVHLGNALLRLPVLRGPYWESLRGSTALQWCVRQRWVEYRTATFTRG